MRFTLSTLMPASHQKIDRSFPGVPQSLIFDTLGPGRLTEFTAVRVPGKIVWFNLNLGRSLGFEVGEGKSADPQSLRRINDLLSVHVLQPGEKLGDREPTLLYADKYGGDDLGRCLGAGRAGFLPLANLYLKGVGHTPLFRHDDPNDFDHSHGAVSMIEGMLEAVFGEVNTNLFSKGSARILAIIDQGDYSIYPSGKKEPRALVIRAGDQLRPAHLFARGVKGGLSKLEVFTRITRRTGQLRTREADSQSIDLRHTMLQVIDDHALTAAEQFRWRIIHGAVSMSNMEMSGAMLDATTESAQPRTAPMRVLMQHPGAYLVFGLEHLERARHLKLMFQSLVKSLTSEQRYLLNAGPIDFHSAMNRSYEQHVKVQMLQAAGLTIPVAKYLATYHQPAAHRFQQVLRAMAALRNRGSINANTPPVTHISVLDIFNLLQQYPRLYFRGLARAYNPQTLSPASSRAPRQVSAAVRRAEAQVLAMLRPEFRGNRFYRATQKNTVLLLIRQFVDAYAEVMSACESIAVEHYGSVQNLRDSITSRATYQNRPLTAVYRGQLLKDFAALIARYKAAGQSEMIGQTITRVVASSHRNLDQNESSRPQKPELSGTAAF